MSDNTILKDAGDNQYTLRAKDVSLAQDGSMRRSLVFATHYPIDYASGGCYHHTSKSGVMAAGLGAGVPIFTFRNPSSTLLAILRRIRLDAYTDSIGFSAGLATFDMFVARSFSAMDTGGTTTNLASPQATLRTSMAAASSVIQHSTTGALTPGTRTLDAGPIETIVAPAPTTASTKFFTTPIRLYEHLQGEYPLVMAQNEGFTIQATVPATGNWHWQITPEWDEVPLAQHA